jgi:AraC-like DNA-binding protein
MDSGPAATLELAALFSTAELGPRDQFDAWREEIRRSFGPAEVVRPETGAFRATIETLVLDDLAVSCIVGDAMTFERTAGHIARSEHDGFTVGLLLEGNGAAEQADRDARLRPGDLVLCDARRPMRICFDGPFQQIIFHCDRAQLESRLPDAEQRLARRIEGQAALSAMAGYVAATARHGPPAVTAHAVARHAFEVLALAIGGSPARSPAARSCLERIHEYIERHLCDPALTPLTIANHHRLSRRQLYRLFDAVGDSVAAFIRRRRLMRCKAILGDALQAERSITEIALACGFNDPTTFGRAFRSAFGMTPRGYRRLTRARHRGIGESGIPPGLPPRADQFRDLCEPIARWPSCHANQDRIDS